MPAIRPCAQEGKPFPFLELGSATPRWCSAMATTPAVGTRTKPTNAASSRDSIKGDTTPPSAGRIAMIDNSARKPMATRAARVMDQRRHDAAGVWRGDAWVVEVAGLVGQCIEAAPSVCIGHPDHLAPGDRAHQSSTPVPQQSQPRYPSVTVSDLAGRVLARSAWCLSTESNRPIKPHRPHAVSNRNRTACGGFRTGRRGELQPCGSLARRAGDRDKGTGHRARATGDRTKATGDMVAGAGEVASGTARPFCNMNRPTCDMKRPYYDMNPPPHSRTRAERQESRPISR